MAQRLTQPYNAEELQAIVTREGSPLLLIDCDVIRARFFALSAALPGVTLHYALKALSDPSVVRTLSEAGCSFDLATNGETDIVRSLGISPDICINTHPIKRPSDIAYGLDFGVKIFVVDNIDEINKFVAFKDRAALLLRISFPNPGAACDLSKKFGCTPSDAMALLEHAASIGVAIVGFSFHVGSQVPRADEHVHAIERCTGLLDEARRAGFKLRIIDIGGGFPAFLDRTEGDRIAEFCAPIRAALAKLPADVKLLAEPGRFMIASAGTCLASVMGRSKRNGAWWYYLDDGVYGSFSGQIYDHFVYPVDSLKQDGPKLPSVLVGPTCDSIDVVNDNVQLPELVAGDIVFNLFPRARIIPINTQAQVPAEAAQAAQ